MLLRCAAVAPCFHVFTTHLTAHGVTGLDGGSHDNVRLPRDLIGASEHPLLFILAFSIRLRSPVCDTKWPGAPISRAAWSFVYVIAITVFVFFVLFCFFSCVPSRSYLWSSISTPLHRVCVLVVPVPPFGPCARAQLPQLATVSLLQVECCWLVCATPQPPQPWRISGLRPSKSRWPQRQRKTKKWTLKMFAPVSTATLCARARCSPSWTCLTRRRRPYVTTIRTIGLCLHARAFVCG